MNQYKTPRNNVYQLNKQFIDETPFLNNNFLSSLSPKENNKEIVLEKTIILERKFLI